MKALSIILTILLVLVCVTMIVVVMLQESKNNGLGSLAGAAGESYVSRNQARTPEGRLQRLTKILGAAFIVIALVLDILQ